MTIGFDMDLGVNTLKGMVTLRDTELWVEWRRYDLFGAPVGPLETLSVSYSDLAAIKVRRKFFRPVIEITANSASTFGPMPLPAGDLTTFKARAVRADREKAAHWGAEAYLRIAEAMPGGDLLE